MGRAGASAACPPARQLAHPLSEVPEHGEATEGASEAIFPAPLARLRWPGKWEEMLASGSIGRPGEGGINWAESGAVLNSMPKGAPGGCQTRRRRSGWHPSSFREEH